MEIPIGEVRIGKRHRKELGNIEALANSILLVGLLHPIVVRPDKTLVVGQRRLAAFKLLARHDPRFNKIPANVAKTFDELGIFLQAEAEENTCREAFLPSEAVSVAKAIREAFLPWAKAAMREGQVSGASKGGKTAGRGRPIASRGSSPKGKQDEAARTSSVASKPAGMDRRTLEKAEAVVASGDKVLIAEMDRTRKVSGAYKKLVVRKAVEQIAAEPPPLPKGPFRVIVADPPWRYDKRADDLTHRAANPYPTMTIEEIAAMPIKELAMKDAVLWLWVTNAFLPVVWPIVQTWEFEYKTMLTWGKSNKMGTGDWLRGATEHCLMCIRGKPTINLTNQTTLLLAHTRAHSQKPDEFYALVEQLCPGSKLELFQRTPRKNWIGYGNDCSAG